MERVATGRAYQGCEKVVVVLSHHAHGQDLQKRSESQASETGSGTAVAWEHRIGGDSVDEKPGRWGATIPAMDIHPGLFHCTAFDLERSNWTDDQICKWLVLNEFYLWTCP